MKSQKIAPVAATTEAEKEKNETTVSAISLKKSTTIPPDVMAMQRKQVAANSPGTEKLVAETMKISVDKALIEILKNSLADVTSALKSYANATHRDRHHPLPFVTCQKEECIYGRGSIDKAIGIIAKASRFSEIDEELAAEPDPDDYHDGIDVCADCDKPITPHDDDPCRCIGKAEVDA